MIYQTPYSTAHPVSRSVFLDEFLAYLESAVMFSEPLLIIGDCNIVLKSSFCKWHALIGQHFCQAFSQKDKIVRASQLWLRRHCVFPHLINRGTVRLQSQ